MDGQMPHNPTTDPRMLTGVAPNVPTAALPLAQSQSQAQAAVTPQGPVQQAVTVLMNPQLSPHDKAKGLASIKEDYLLKTYGVTIE